LVNPLGFFLPQFFVYVGLFLNLRIIGPADWGYLIAAIVLTFVSKALLCIPTKFILKYSWSDAAFISALANCRGFNGLVIGSAGQAAGVIGPTFYVFCVAVSLCSSGAAGPVCRALKASASTAVSPISSPEKQATIRAIPLDNLDPPKEEDLRTPDPDVAGPIEIGGPSIAGSLTDDETELNEPALPEPVLHSILGHERRREMAYLWMEDVVALLHDPIQGLKAVTPVVPSVNDERKNQNNNHHHQFLQDPVFSGKEIVDWIMRHYHLPLRTYAEGVGFDLLHRGFLQGLQPEHRTRSGSLEKFFSTSSAPIFDDTHHYYRLINVAKEINRPVHVHMERAIPPRAQTEKLMAYETPRKHESSKK